MPKRLTYTLLPDGTSDRAFLPILTWLLIENGIKVPIDGKASRLGQLPSPPKTLAERINKSIELAPCDLLFIHRDAEREPRERRLEEIHHAIGNIKIPFICLIPVRMLEAWLLFDEIAIRKAAGNPNGRSNLNLPPIRSIESIPDPKNQLCHILRDASELNGRRLKMFIRDEREKIIRIGDFIQDFSPLRQLGAFRALEAEIKKVIQEQSWHST